MEFNKITSELKYLGSSIRKMTIDNPLISLDDDTEKDFGLDFDIQEVSESESTRFGVIVMQISILIKPHNGQGEAKFDMEIEGGFSAPLSMPKDEFLSLLSLNGSTALYSIARAKFESISAAAFFQGKLILPMVNMFSFLEEKIRESTRDSEND